MKSALILLVVALYGCATKVVTAPSTQQLQSNLGHASAHIEQAKSLAQRIHDKDVIIDRWYETHKQP